MKISVKVDNESCEVEVGDIHARPVIAVIDGESFEVWPEEVVLAHPATHSPAVRAATSPQTRPVFAATSAASISADTIKTVRAPIPGVIISVAVKAGDVVTHGQELCMLEAMKMKNVIRASRAGTIGVVHIAAQQHVKHHDVLMEYTD